MQYKVKDIGEDGVDVDLAIAPAWLTEHVRSAELEIEPAPAGLAFKGRIEPTGDEFLLRGKLAGVLALPCSRCLERAELALDVDVSVIYVEREASDEEDASELDEEALEAPDVLTFQDGLIDLSSELRDEILLAVPVSVLCREDCAGLCPICGGNRNEAPCDCVERESQRQGKFAALAKLKS